MILHGLRFSLRNDLPPSHQGNDRTRDGCADGFVCYFLLHLIDILPDPISES